ncbi:hypothetical protein PMAYCL1PPCAC_30389 [Pristionchus mayeri]|uniref:THAP-type domain-containing protein n=1 Tax=Pristionchus mayeri TaxID=1317129 RepID=A0AAN5ID42_9BILA|nr:hypothetical protein PMAYCL1PPCAC_30389 [Pristionchus mayeri]
MSSKSSNYLARNQEQLPIQSLMKALTTERCIVCEESLIPGEYFALPTEVSELKRWAHGLFPRDPDDFQLFIEHTRVMNEPFLCSAHFSRESIMSERPLRLFPRSTPVEYEGSMRNRTAKMWQRRKCIVCGAQRPSDEVYPFTQKTPLVEVWCNSIFPNDIKSSQRLLKLAIRAVSPTLCGEHFPSHCFDRARDLIPNSIPTMAKVRTHSNVMDILNKAKADLQKVLPGNYIPREDVWAKVDRDAGFVDGIIPNLSSKITPMNNASAVQPSSRKPSMELRSDPFLIEQPLRDYKKESPLLFDSSKLAEEPMKEEEDLCSIELPEHYQWNSLGEGTSSSPSSHAQGMRDESEVHTDEVPPKRRPGRPRKNFPQPTKTAEPDPAVTTRFGRQVKRKVIEDYAVAKRRDKTKEGVAKAHRQFIRQQREKAREEKETEGEETGQPREKKVRSRPNKLQMQKGKCSMCRSTVEATLFGMKEHAREHCQESLKCPFEPCDVISTKRSRIAQHTQVDHQRWALPIDLCETNKNLDREIKMTMERCFPSAMKRANESGSAPCTICSLIVSPDYRSLYSHACIHLPSRPFHCSECVAFEAYTEEEIEYHHKEAKCGGDVVSKMDDAVISLVESLFKTAFPMYAHLLDDMNQMDVDEGVQDPLPLFQSTSDESPGETRKKEEQELHEFPNSSLSVHPSGDYTINDASPHGESNYIDEKPVVNSVDHDHQYTGPMKLLEPVLHHDLLDNFKVDDIEKIEM